MTTPSKTAPQHVIDACTVRYGVPLMQIGEDGDVLILGHDHEPRRLVAALAADHRFIYGERMAADLEAGYMVTDVLDQLAGKWAVVAYPCGSEHNDEPGRHYNSADPDCPRCRIAAEPADTEWFVFWNRDSEDPDAFPVTVFEVDQ